MIKLTPFRQADFSRLISWIDSKELLVTIAGTIWTYPLTADQLLSYLNDPKSHSFNIVETGQNTTIGHAEIIVSDDGTCKIDKLIVGDPAQRGKGIGQLVMQELLSYAFGKLPVHTVELNVFDWNHGAIRCYEKVGFTFNPAKKQTFEMDNHKWVALNMTLKKEQWKFK